MKRPNEMLYFMLLVTFGVLIAVVLLPYAWDLVSGGR